MSFISTLKKLRTIFTVQVSDPLIESLENDESLQKKRIACQKHINVIKKDKVKYFKRSIICFILTIICILYFVLSYITLVRESNEIILSKYNVVEKFMLSLSENLKDIGIHTINVDENNIVYINDVSINQIIEDNVNESEINNKTLYPLLIIFIIMFACVILFINYIFSYIMIESTKRYEDMMIQYDEEIDFDEIKNAAENPLPDKQFKQHQRELKRYYDLNLNQSKSMYNLGIFVIVAGVLIVLFTLLLFREPKDNNVVPLAIGCITGVITDFVGVVFISMYSQSLKASIEYHNKLVYSNNLLLSNVVSNRITDESKRNETYSNVAIEIAKTNILDTVSNN